MGEHQVCAGVWTDGWHRMWLIFVYIPFNGHAVVFFNNSQWFHKIVTNPEWVTIEPLLISWGLTGLALRPWAWYIVLSLSIYNNFGFLYWRTLHLIGIFDLLTLNSVANGTFSHVWMKFIYHIFFPEDPSWSSCTWGQQTERLCGIVGGILDGRLLAGRTETWQPSMKQMGKGMLTHSLREAARAPDTPASESWDSTELWTWGLQKSGDWPGACTEI